MDLDLIMESLKADTTNNDTSNYLIVDDGDYGINDFGNGGSGGGGSSSNRRK
jgi:hypothetical protein